ncbi:HTH DNA binding protein [Mycobacterium phage Adzzy]|uniref:HTH DNA binding protein n=1 Tax=Mycobacterium phage Adzzy TaxID=1383059 RepID=UPI0003880B15|nr:HTH DNA binding protein [Mycobacterium phage Adzzy]AGT14298.1 HTH DNA binding protein [Mycobacterium phage Adzzy]ATW60177.1 helix-turn-helix DNA binding domain protein [Mycobacterium phage Ph8s]
MRKKHLREANTKLARDLGKAKAEISDKDYRITNLLGENEILRSANVRLSEAANRALRENGELREANRKFALKERSQNELFGKAFAQVKPETGPSRPNRRKLTEREVRDIREAYRGGMKQKDLASNYDVNPATISRTVRGIYH